MSRGLLVLFVLLGCIAIPVVSVLIINTSFELVRSFYPSFYDSYLLTKYVTPVSLILTLIAWRGFLLALKKKWRSKLSRSTGRR
jgi:hypothetical protein